VSDLIGKVRERLNRLGAARAGMVVAVSGGPDSVALLHALLQLQPPLLVVAHFNHQLRGPEADADEAFVRDLVTSLVAQGHQALRLSCERRDIAALATAEQENVEAIARRERYRWLAKVACANGLSLVATGHTADDQAETVLHRLFRGTGLQGLRGIAARRPLEPGIDLIRPMLDVTRAEVLDFLKSGGHSSRLDSTNTDLEYTRNRIRHELLPYLEKHFNPAVREVLGRLAEQAEELFAEQQAEVEELLRRAERPRAGDLIILDRATLQAASRRLVRDLFRHIWAREGWPVGRMGFEHWRRLVALVFDELTAIDLPERIHARRQERVIQLGTRRAPIGD
jgi:tRNA(Ile)-lysidine synthase